VTRTLIIDTSGPACSVALADDGVLIAHHHAVIDRGHAERLLPAIAALAGGGRADHIRVGCGPGSFTGVRVGISAARALAYGWGVPVDGFNSLGLIARQCGAACLVVVEGGHGEYFVQPFAADGTEAGALAALRPDDAATRFDQPVVAGNRAADFVARRGYGTAHNLLCDARAALIGAAAASIAPSPTYGRAPDAAPQPGLAPA
jgi:tRNA threonylcarbamoyl adenosine modification protein YeaZ